MENDFIKAFAPHSLNDIDLSGWDFTPNPEAERLIREVLMEKAVNGTRCQSEYAMEVLKSMKV